jgi:hypothetical protein
LLVVAIVAYCWAAVGWHRYVLMEETGNGFLPQWRGDRDPRLFRARLRCRLVVMLAVIGGGILIGRWWWG